MNPYLIIGVLIGWLASLAGVGWWQNTAGHTAERTAWQTRENTELRTANATIITLQASARRSEQNHALALAEISSTYQKDLTHATKQRAADVAAVRAGTLRLRVQYPAPANPDHSGVLQAAAGASRCDGPPAADLPAAITGDLLALAADADDLARQLAACQRVITADRAAR